MKNREIRPKVEITSKQKKNGLKTDFLILGEDGDDEDVDWSSSDESWSSEWSEDDHLGPVLFRWGSRTFQFQEVINPNTIDGIFNKTAGAMKYI